MCHVENGLLEPEDQELLRCFLDYGTYAIADVPNIPTLSGTDVLNYLGNDLLHGGEAKDDSFRLLVVLDLQKCAGCTRVRKTTVI
jgi:hypothetical protein